MAFTVVPVTTAAPVGGYSQPDRVSFVVSDDGAGGSILINGRGINAPTVANAVDLATLFGTAFQSTPLLRAFRVASTSQAGFDQFVKNLEWIINGQNGTGYAGVPAFSYTYGLGGGPSDVPYLIIAGASVAGLWRVDLRLRHSVTN